MIQVTSVENMRKSDEFTIKSSTPAKELMYRAGKGIFESHNWQGKTLIACGTGNNAGDGYVLASLLSDGGYDVSLLLLEERFSVDGEHYFNICKEKKVPWSVYNSEKIEDCNTVVDCVFGTGFKGEPRGKAKELIEAINESGAFVLSADINSGLNGDSGLGVKCVKSELTVSIGTYKCGHFLGMAKDLIKEKQNIDIGINLIESPYSLIEKKDVKEFLGKRQSYSNKGTYGYIALIGGCTEYSGAVKLANLAASAMRAGAGVTKLCVPKSLVASVSPYLLESTLCPLSDRAGSVEFRENEIQGALNGVKAIGVGMGLGQRGDNQALLSYILNNYSLPIVIDADGLNTLAKMDLSILKSTKCKAILTPHPKELERLSDVPLEKILESPVECAVNFARKTGAVVLLKGAATVITDGERVILSDTGCAGMATAGSGDVLSGIITALCASHSDTLMCAAAGAYINGLAGELASLEFGDISMVASDTARSIAKAVNLITK